MLVEIDEGSGFCFGVTTAIRKAEEELAKEQKLFCLGDIVHNGKECERLREMGLVTIDYNQMNTLHDANVMFRAHGESPSIYHKALLNNINIIDATCPVVLNLQKRIKKDYNENGDNTQIAIYGKNGHAEVTALVGQTEGNAIVIEQIEDIDKLNFEKNISLYSQTTKSLEGFRKLIDAIAKRMNMTVKLGTNMMKNENGLLFKFYDTVCRQVANRINDIQLFSQKHDVIVFVAGKKSSNGKVLFDECRKVNTNAYLVEQPEQIKQNWFFDAHTVGICGATSTPKWLMEQCREYILKL